MLVDEVVEPSPPSAADTASEARDPMPWERQPDETLRQFWAFGRYRDQHPATRSLAEVARELGCSDTYTQRLSSRLKWVRRAGKWDEERDRQRRIRLLNHLEEIENRHLLIADTALLCVSGS